MNISEVIDIIKAEIVFKRTPSGRSINEFAIESLVAAVEDKNNYDVEAIKCQLCCIIQSSLLVPSGCPNCGIKGDMTTKFMKENIQ